MNISNLLSNAGLSGADGSNGANLNAASQSGATQGLTSTSSSQFANASSGDEVSLSGVSQLLQNNSAQRTANLASLTSAVRAGSYNVSGPDISRSLVSEVLARSSAQ